MERESLADNLRQAYKQQGDLADEIMTTAHEQLVSDGILPETFTSEAEKEYQNELLTLYLQRGLGGATVEEKYLELVAMFAEAWYRVEQRLNRQNVTPGAASQGEVGQGDEPLTPRETEIANCLADGLSDKDIADKLTIAPNTVKKCRQNIKGKWGASSQSAGVLQIEAKRRGYGESKPE